MYFIRIEKQQPVRRIGERLHVRERTITHVGEIHERVRAHAQRSARGKRTRFEHREIVAMREPRVVVDREQIDGIGERGDGRAEVRLAGCAHAESAGDRDR